jgi:hypothetical protein
MVIKVVVRRKGIFPWASLRPKSAITFILMGKGRIKEDDQDFAYRNKLLCSLFTWF